SCWINLWGTFPTCPPLGQPPGSEGGERLRPIHPRQQVCLRRTETSRRGPARQSQGHINRGQITDRLERKDGAAEQGGQRRSGAGRGGRAGGGGRVPRAGPGPAVRAAARVPSPEPPPGAPPGPLQTPSLSRIATLPETATARSWRPSPLISSTATAPGLLPQR